MLPYINLCITHSLPSVAALIPLALLTWTPSKPLRSEDRENASAAPSRTVLRMAYGVSDNFSLYVALLA